MCLKNIRIFLQACRRHFDLKEADLFDPAMLYDYSDFGKVLRTLSKLSKCPKVARLGYEYAFIYIFFSFELVFNLDLY
jgi:guanine nucleotide exchange factor VAV